MAVIQEMLQQIVRERASVMAGFQPDIPRLLGRVSRAEGLTLTCYSARFPGQARRD